MGTITHVLWLLKKILTEHCRRALWSLIVERLIILCGIEIEIPY